MPNKIWISTGKSRFDKTWSNREIGWEAFLNKLNKPVITKETHAQYLKYAKDKQDQIKDVGGFVGGIVNGGRRKKNSVSARYLITLDIDYAAHDILTDISLAYDNELVLYSTHKHGPDQARFRLVMPLEREVHSDEYEAIARRVAGDIGIELFDPTTFQPERLMYWPSVSSDVEYYIARQEGPWLDPDKVLAQYDDWRDVSQWPISEKATKKLADSAKAQEDPSVKQNLVGLFCRTYGIREAIEKFIPDIYEEGSEDRLTYKAGSTSNGVIVYDNEFTYSHHATDPTSGRLCNSFDLVRIHLFGESDDRMEEGTPYVKRPSYGKMIEMMLEDSKVKQALVDEKVGSKSGLMKTMTNPIGDDEIEHDWAKSLELSKRGDIQQTIANVVTILEKDERLRGCFAYDDLFKTGVIKKDLPWRKVSPNNNLLRDSDDSEIRNYLEMMYGITNKEKIKDGLEIVLRKYTYHPIRNYLKSVTWDGKPRLDRVLVEYLGAEDSDYVRQVTRKTLIAAVARVFEPGCKFDNVLVLVGAQGIGKSMLVGKLGGEWFSDTFGNLQSKDAMENLQGVWIMEIGELAGLKRQEVDTIKLFVAKQFDQFRIAYGRRVEKFGRQCIFIGTTNNDEFLQDQTGNRRFWPVRCNTREVKVLESEVRDQIWAEACVGYGMGESLFLEGEVEERAREVQEEYTEKDERTKSIAEYLEKKIPEGWYEMDIWKRREFLAGQDDGIGDKLEGTMEREWVTVPEIWTELFRGEIKDMSKFNVKYIRDVMNKMKGWEPRMLNKKGVGHQRGWVRVEPVLVGDVENLLG